MADFTSKINFVEETAEDDDYLKKFSFEDYPDENLYNAVARNIALEGMAHESPITTRKGTSPVGKQQRSKTILLPFSLLSFTCICMATWEIALLANTRALVNGGRAGLFWSYIWTTAGWALISASLAEIESTTPNNDGEWNSEYHAPQKKDFPRYATEWLSSIGRQARTTAGLLLAGKMTQSFTVLSTPDHVLSNWQAPLFVLPWIVVMVVLSTIGSRILPSLQNMGMFMHMLALSAIVVVLGILGPHIPAQKAFLEFSNTGNWSSMGVSIMIGQTSSAAAYLGVDTATYMSEVLHDRGAAVSKAIMNAFWINAILGLIVVTTFVQSFPSLDGSSLDNPLLSILHLTLPLGGIIAVLVILIALVAVNTIATATASSRDTIHFETAHGLPPHCAWLAAKTGSSHTLFPITALALLFSLLPFVPHASSPVDSALALATASQLAVHVVRIATHLRARLAAPPPAHLPSGDGGDRAARRWLSVRRVRGVVVNGLALLYAANTAFWSVWPTRAGEVNYGGVFLGCAVAVALLYYLSGGVRTELFWSGMGECKDEKNPDNIMLIRTWAE